MNGIIKSVVFLVDYCRCRGRLDCLSGSCIRSCSRCLVFSVGSVGIVSSEEKKKRESEKKG